MDAALPGAVPRGDDGEQNGRAGPGAVTYEAFRAQFTHLDLDRPMTGPAAKAAFGVTAVAGGQEQAAAPHAGGEIRTVVDGDDAVAAIVGTGGGVFVDSDVELDEEVVWEDHSTTDVALTRWKSPKPIQSDTWIGDEALESDQGEGDGAYRPSMLEAEAGEAEAGTAVSAAAAAAAEALGFEPVADDGTDDGAQSDGADPVAPFVLDDAHDYDSGPVSRRDG